MLIFVMFTDHYHLYLYPSLFRQAAAKTQYVTIYLLSTNYIGE